MNIEAVIGANYGDEGKGLVTDYLAMSNPNSIVVLNNGGCQRGHTVEHKDGTRHVFHHFGSGTLRLHPTYFTENFYLNPMEFIREFNELMDQHVVPVSYYDKNCILQLPSDIALNWHIERCRENMEGGRYGSVGSGIWETASRVNPITFDEFVKLGYLEKVRYITGEAEIYRNCRCRQNRVSDRVELFDLFLSQGFIDHFIADCMEMARLCRRSDNLLDCVKNNGYDTVIVENGQGLMLDETYSHDPRHSTPSKTGANGIKNIVTQLNPEKITLNYVTRTYLTRHGNGDFADEKIGDFVDSTNVFNEWQGNLRYGRLDVEKTINRCLSDSISLSRKTIMNMFVTHVNEFDIGYYGDYSSNSKYAEDIIRHGII